MLEKDNVSHIFIENQNGVSISNKDLKGQKAVLYFYPRDNTPTCTTEACDFRDNLAF